MNCVEVLDVDTGVTHVVEAGARAEPPLKRMWLEQAASVRMVGALQERLVVVKEERVMRHSELRASEDAKVKAAVKETLAQVADALECACCFEPSPLEQLWPSSAVTPTATDKRAPPRRRRRAPGVGSTSERACPSLGNLPTCVGFCATPDAAPPCEDGAVAVWHTRITQRSGVRTTVPRLPAAGRGPARVFYSGGTIISASTPSMGE